jgi:hypothetical protein
MKILALDLGKFNSMCCFFDTKTRKHSFLLAATERNYLQTVFQQHQIDLVVMEACGPSGWINDLAVQCGLKTLVCSTNEDGGVALITNVPLYCSCQELLWVPLALPVRFS